MTRRDTFEASVCFWNTFREGRGDSASADLNQDEETMIYYKLCNKWKSLICEATKNREEFLARTDESQSSDTPPLFTETTLYSQMNEQLKAFLEVYKNEIKNDSAIKQAQRFYHLKAILNLGMEYNKEAAITQLRHHQKSSLPCIKKEAEELFECLSGILTEDEDGMLKNYSAQLNALIVQRQKQLDEEEIDDHFLRA